MAEDRNACVVVYQCSSPVEKKCKFFITFNHDNRTRCLYRSDTNECFCESAISDTIIKKIKFSFNEE